MQPFTYCRQAGRMLLLAGLLSCVTGCELTSATVTLQPGYFTVQPDVIVIRPFAVTMEETKRDQEIVPSWMLRHVRSEPQTELDIREGRLVEETLTRYLIMALKIRGIRAELAADVPQATKSTGIITGQFVNAPSGVKTVRPAIGYTIKRGLEARVQLVQGGVCVGEILLDSDNLEIETSAKNAAVKIADVIFHGYVTLGWLPPDRQ